MQKKYKMLLLTALTIFCSNAISYNSEKPIFVAVGMYANIENKFRPLIAVSKSLEKSFAFPSVKLSDKDNNYNVLKSVSCNNNYCAVTGYYSLIEGKYPPLLIVSADQGLSWSQIKTLPTNAIENNTHFNAVSCKDSMCVIAGSYMDNNNKSWPLLALDNSKGTSWTYPETIITHLPAVNFPEFLDVNCSHTSCVAVGSYVDEKSFKRPLLATSIDNGVTWSYPALNISHKDVDNDAILYNVNCNGEICVASGQYQFRKDTKKEKITITKFPLIFASKDKGQTWREAIIPQTPVPLDPYFADRYHISDIKCSSSFCVAAGDYGISEYPLLIVSHDEGLSWSYPDTIMSMLPSGAKVSDFIGISLNEDFGIVSGKSEIEKKDSHELISKPWVAITHDKGVTWSYVIAKLPSICRGSILFSDISCDGNVCTTTGVYTGKVMMPLLGMSYDKGQSWSYPLEEAGFTMLPADFVRGEFSRHYAVK